MPISRYLLEHADQLSPAIRPKTICDFSLPDRFRKWMSTDDSNATMAVLGRFEYSAPQSKLRFLSDTNCYSLILL
jgi:hypothetical protein